MPANVHPAKIGQEKQVLLEISDWRMDSLGMAWIDPPQTDQKKVSRANIERLGRRRGKA
jgi:hypothetical protein